MKTATIYIFLVGSVFCKLLLAYFIPVFGDEAYYYIWSLHPQLSYFDHPPLVSWFVYLGHLALPAGNPISLRVAFILASAAASVVWIKILRLKNFNNKTIFIWLALLFLNPLLGVGSILATPDGPLVLFWSLSYYCYLKIVLNSTESHTGDGEARGAESNNKLNKKSLKWYALLGVALGLGFCAKYHIVLFVISGLVYLVLTKKLRTLRLKGIFYTIIFGALFSLPVIIWNAQNNWTSFLFQLQHGFGENHFEWAWPLGYLVAQLVIINPVIFYSLFKSQAFSVDKTFSFSQLIFFFLSSFKSVVEGNWPLTSHLHSTTHFCAVSTGRRESEVQEIKYAKYAINYWLVFYGALAVFFTASFAKDASDAIKKNQVNSAQTAELLDLIESYKPLYGPSYQVASLLSWKSQQIIPKLGGLSRYDFYDSLSSSSPTDTRFYVLKYNNSEWPKKYEHFNKIKLQSFDKLGLELYQFIYE